MNSTVRPSSPLAIEEGHTCSDAADPTSLTRPQRFLSLTEFAKHLGRTGVAHVDENEKGWWISWIDTSPRALARAESNQKKERGDIDDEMRQRKLIQEQIERAREEGERRKREAALAAAGGPAAGEGEGPGAAGALADEPSNELKRDEGEKLSLNLSFKTPAAAAAPCPSPPLDTSTAAATSPSAPTAPADPSSSTSTPSIDAAAPSAPTAGAASTSTSSSAPASAAAPVPAPSKFIAPPSKPVIGFTPRANPLAAKPKPNPLKGGGGNPLKKPNPLKGPGGGAGAGAGTEKRKAPMSAVEQIAMEEMARKQRRMK